MPPDTTNWPVVEVDETTALLIRARGYIERGRCRDVWPAMLRAMIS
jgi:hypothetical protein